MFITALVSGSILHWLAVDALGSAVRSDLIRTASAASTVIDGDLHRQFTSPDQESSELYKKAIQPLERIRKAAVDLRFIYTCWPWFTLPAASSVEERLFDSSGTDARAA